MQGKRMLTIPIITGLLAFVGGWAISAQDKYTVKVQGEAAHLSSSKGCSLAGISISTR